MIRVQLRLPTLLIRPPKKVERLIVFASFFFLPKFCLNEYSVTAGQIVLKFGEMVDMDVKLCYSVSKFKMLD